MDSEPTRNLDIIDEQHTIPFATKAKELKHLQESVLHCSKICRLPQQVHGFWWGSRHGMAPGMFTSRTLIYFDVAQFQIISCLLKLRPSCRWFIQLLPFAINLSSTSGSQWQQMIFANSIKKEHWLSSSNSKWWSAGMIAAYNLEARGPSDVQICLEPPSCPDFHNSFHSAGFWKFHWQKHAVSSKNSVN